MASWYVGSTKWTAVTAWAASTAYSVGDLRRQLAAPSVGNERVFRCTTAGTSGASEPTWILTVGSTTNDGSAVWTEVTGNSTYGWTAAHARLSNAFASGWGAAGDTFYVSNNHAETQSVALSLFSPGTAASLCRVLCVTDTATPPTALNTTASVTTTGASLIIFYGFAYYYGIIFNCGTGSTSTSISCTTTSSWWMRFESCSLRIINTGSSSAINFGTASTSVDDGSVEWVNTTLQFSNAGQRVANRCRLIWSNTLSAILGTVPTTLFIHPGGNGEATEVRGVDLSAIGSGGSLAAINSASPAVFRFIDCKLGSSVSVTSGSATGQGGALVTLVNCDSADTNYRYHKQGYQGTITQETTIVKTSPAGASDGTTTVSRKMVTTANSKFESPLVSDPIEIWNETLSSITVTIPVITDNVTLTDAEAWIEVEYLGTSGFPISSCIKDRAADVLATPANQTTDGSSTWTTTGLTTPVKQSLAVTFTPAEKGIIRIRVNLAKASTTMYFDPLAVVT